VKLLQKHGRSGLGFVDNCSSMPYTFGVKNVCVKKAMLVPASSDKGKKVMVDLIFLDLSLRWCTLLGNNLLKGLFQLVIIVTNLVIPDLTVSS
jgi:hypothetical protein